jgi:predicted phosphodiesterase
MAVFADVHSNLHALEAVLKDIESRGAGRVYCLGDLVGYGPRPNEVIEMIKAKGIPAVMGNYDDAIGNARFICGCDYKDEQSLRLGEKSIAWTRDNTSEESKAWLRGLPAEIRDTISGKRLLFVHGSPKALNEYIYESTPEEYFNRLLVEGDADVLLCGHTHLPFVKKTDAGYVINAGSAGKPKHGNPRAVYITIEFVNDLLQADIIEVPYNYEATAGEIERAGLPPEFAAIIRTGGA